MDEKDDLYDGKDYETELTFWQNFWMQFLDLLRSSTIIQGTMTLFVVGVWLFILAQEHTPPDVLTNIVGVVVGFYFGGKVQQAITKIGGDSE